MCKPTVLLALSQLLRWASSQYHGTATAPYQDVIFCSVPFVVLLGFTSAIGTDPRVHKQSSVVAVVACRSGSIRHLFDCCSIDIFKHFPFGTGTLLTGVSVCARGVFRMPTQTFGSLQANSPENSVKYRVVIMSSCYHNDLSSSIEWHYPFIFAHLNLLQSCLHCAQCSEMSSQLCPAFPAVIYFQPFMKSPS